MSIETRSSSALFKRAEQLKRWQEGETSKEPTEPRNKSRKIQFSDGCVFLAACAATDKEEVERLVARGADIDTCNVDGLTALHQACIDDNLEMVEFLVNHGADVNRGDNEGWTPLHATASCGFLSIAKFLLEHGSNVSAVNNDGELAIDISESDEIEELLQKEIDRQGINCDESRNTEERIMLEDAKRWAATGQCGDVPHSKTGATALHVAAAKGYIKVMGLLIQAGVNLNAQDFDGWTPLHAAAHWAQREACEILCENLANMDIKNYVGQTCFDVADPDVLRLLEELRKKQATLQKDRPDVRNLINRPPIPASLTGSGGKRRSSITRLSIDDKALRLKEDLTGERDLLLNKGGSLVSETIQESNKSSNVIKTRGEADSDSEVGESEESDETIHAKTKAGLEACRKNRANLSENIPRITFSKDENNPNRAPGFSPPHLDTSEKKKGSSGSPGATTPESEEVHPWRRPLSLRGRPTGSSSTTSSTYNSVSSTINKLSPSGKEDEDIPLRRVHSFESDEKFYARLAELRERIRATSVPAVNDLPCTPMRTSSLSSYKNKTATKNSKYLTSSSSSSSNANSIFSSLPRSVGHRTLPSLPESPVSGSGSSVGTVGSPGALVRSSSLRDNSSYSPLPFRNSSDQGTPSHNNNNNNNVVTTSSTNTTNNINNNNTLNNNNNNNTRIEREERLVRTAITTTTAAATKTTLTTTIATATTTTTTSTLTSNPSRPSSLLLIDGGDLPQGKRRDPEGGPKPKSDPPKPQQPPPPQLSQVRRSFVPPVRDEESETQRKAHAKRVRETRRSTQGVTLEDLKSAEQLVKKKQQEENQQRTSELQQLVQQQQQQQQQQQNVVGSTATTTVTTSSSSIAPGPAAAAATASIATTTSSSSSTGYSSSSTPTSEHERRPSWRLRTDGGDKNRFRLDDVPRSSGPSETLSALRRTSKMENTGGVGGKGPPPLPATEPPSLSPDDNKEGGGAKSTLPVIQRRKKPKRRSTGVVHIDVEDLDGKRGSESDEDQEDESLHGDDLSGNRTSNTISRSDNKSQNGDVDYKKLWEESQMENTRLREQLSKSEEARGHLEGALQNATKPPPLSEMEKREKRALEKKLSEMEEELKQVENLKNEIQRLRDENGALIRVISKLSK